VAAAGDHGESLGEHAEWTHRIFIYDSTMHVPFWISGPGIAPNRIQAQARLIDFFPTILSLLKITVPSGIDGSVLPQKAGSHALLESFFPRFQLGWSPLVGIRTPEWKYIEAPKPELYDLKSDRSEKQNVVAKYPTRQTP
jgi:arylsulfatase A-like enzyme